MNQNTAIKRLPAFTLVEVLVYSILLGIITVGVSSILFQTFRIQSVVSDKANLTANLRQLYKSIRDDMYYADDLFVDGGTGDLVLTSSFDTPATVRYSLTGSTIYRTADAGSAIAVTDTNTEVYGFTIEDITSSSVAETVKITVQMRNYEAGLIKPPVDLSVTSTQGLKFVI